MYMRIVKIVDGVETELKDGSFSPSSEGMTSSTVSVICNGPYLYINVGGVVVWSGMDETFSSGNVGIWAGLDRLDRSLTLNSASLYQ